MMFAQVPGGGAMMDGEAAQRLGKIVVEHAVQQPRLMLLEAEVLMLRAENAQLRSALEANTSSRAAS